MKKFDPANVSAQELWDYCMQEYSSTDPRALFLINTFYKRIGRIVHDLPENYRILEVGCGAGESSRKLFAMLRGQYFEASEFDGRYVTKLNQMALPFKVTQESVYQLKRHDREFDCIFLLEVLEHLEDVNAALLEIFRVARRHVVVSVPNEPLWRIMNMCRGKYLRHFGNTPGHINHWNVRRLRKLLSAFGIIEQVHTPPPWIIMVVGLDKSGPCVS